MFLEIVCNFRRTFPQLWVTFRNASQLCATFRNFSHLSATFAVFSEVFVNSQKLPHVFATSRNIPQFVRTRWRKIAHRLFYAAIPTYRLITRPSPTPPPRRRRWADGWPDRNPPPHNLSDENDEAMLAERRRSVAAPTGRLPARAGRHRSPVCRPDGRCRSPVSRPLSLYGDVESPSDCQDCQFRPTMGWSPDAIPFGIRPDHTGTLR